MNEENAIENEVEEAIDSATEAVGVQAAELAELGGADVAGAPIGISHLMGVSVEVTVEVGRKRMSLAELAELGPGSLVVLDREAHEPADILVNGKVVARGEIVVVDGSFGVRVSHVVRGEEG